MREFLADTEKRHPPRLEWAERAGCVLDPLGLQGRFLPATSKRYIFPCLAFEWPVLERRKAAMTNLRLPRIVEDDPAAADLATCLEAHARPLWPGGNLRVAQAPVEPALEAALKSALSAGRIVRGLEAAERVLRGEEQGLKRVDRRTGVERGGRVSRLLVLADDGADRFYRNVESLLRRFSPRVLALRLSVDQAGLGALLFGPDQVARLLLVEHKDAVSAVLLALAAHWSDE
jgi:hypothetical protein